MEILAYPWENGITLFIVGGLLVLSIYHFLLFFQHRDRSYLFYSLYTFLIFLRNIVLVENSFLQGISSITPFLEKVNYYGMNIEWAYNTVYFLFAFSFVDLKSYSQKWYRFIIIGVIVLFTINISAELVYTIFELSSSLYYAMYLIMSGILALFAIVCYIPLLKAKGFLKYYIVVGSACFLFFSILALIESKVHMFYDTGTKFYVSIFYVGVILENMLFSLGLGHKQRLILLEKNKSDQKLIEQLRENEKLKDEIQKQLEKDISMLNKTAERDKLKAIKARYEKDMAELKLASLRSQMNPHFIFNALNSIKSFIIDKHQEKAVYYLNKFSKLVRMILSSSMEKDISLHDELEIAKLYLQIEQIRFDDNLFQFTLTVDEDISLHTIKVPALILQPFLENAIWHGLSNKEGMKKLSLEITSSKELIFVKITDNGIGRKKASEIKKRKLLKRNSYGIKLSEERLRNFVRNSKDKFEIKIIDLLGDADTPTGTQVLVTLPVTFDQKQPV